MPSSIFVVPRDYDETRSDVIPICITKFDEHGEAIDPRWVNEGVEPIHPRLIKLADSQLGDPWLASELVDVTVQRVWKRYRSDLGETPSRRILRTAGWMARLLKAGDWPAAKRPALYLALDQMDLKVRDRLLIDPRDYAELCEKEIMLASAQHAIEDRKDGGMLAEAFSLVRHGWDWSTVAARLNVEPEPLRKRFSRAVKAIARRGA